MPMTTHCQHFQVFDPNQANHLDFTSNNMLGAIPTFEDNILAKAKFSGSIGAIFTMKCFHVVYF